MALIPAPPPRPMDCVDAARGRSPSPAMARPVAAPVVPKVAVRPGRGFPPRPRWRPRRRPVRASRPPDPSRPDAGGGAKGRSSSASRSPLHSGSGTTTPRRRPPAPRRWPSGGLRVLRAGARARRERRRRPAPPPWPPRPGPHHINRLVELRHPVLVRDLAVDEPSRLGGRDRRRRPVGIAPTDERDRSPRRPARPTGRPAPGPPR